MPEPDFGPAYDYAGIDLNPENRPPIRNYGTDLLIHPFVLQTGLHYR